MLKNKVRLLFILIISFVLLPGLYASANTVVEDERRVRDESDPFEDTLSTSEDEESSADSVGSNAPISNPLAAPEEKDEVSTFESLDSAKIIALNKITAKSKELTLKIGQPQYFGNIEIIVHKCLKKLDPYNPDNDILLTVVERNIDEEASTVFQGWILSSSIAVSTFEHPVYEIFAKNCL